MNRLAAIAAVAFCGLVSAGAQGRAGAPVYGYEVVNVYPHDREAFTQGLLFRDGVLYESTGQHGRSSLRKVQLETGKVLQQINVEARYFAEGLTDWGSRLVQLTYQTNIGFVYDLASFKRLQTFSYTGEGWGLAHDDRQLIMSDGTATLRFLDPQTFAVTRRVQVTDGGLPVPQSERDGVHRWADLRQRVADRSHCDNRSGHRPGHRLDQPCRSVARQRRRVRRCPERDRL